MGSLHRKMGGTAAMMGTKIRSFAPLPCDVSLEDLVPKDSFYRRLEERLDLAFVRDLVRPLYATGGRPSIDPVVFFKLQLVMFFEGLRSERELMRVAADRLSVRWYLGYDLHEPLPDHSNLTRTRDRFGLAVFRRFFEEVVGRCADAGLVRGEELFFDSTKVGADADVDSLASRHFGEPSGRPLRGRRRYHRNAGSSNAADDRGAAERRKARALGGERREKRLGLAGGPPGPRLRLGGPKEDRRLEGQQDRSRRHTHARGCGRDQARLPGPLRRGWRQGAHHTERPRRPRRGLREPPHARPPVEDGLPLEA